MNPLCISANQSEVVGFRGVGKSIIVLSHQPTFCQITQKGQFERFHAMILQQDYKDMLIGDVQGHCWRRLQAWGAGRGRVGYGRCEAWLLALLVCQGMDGWKYEGVYKTESQQ